MIFALFSGAKVKNAEAPECLWRVELG